MFDYDKEGNLTAGSRYSQGQVTENFVQRLNGKKEIVRALFTPDNELVGTVIYRFKDKKILIPGQKRKFSRYKKQKLNQLI